MNKIVIITGCSSGFGYRTALKFARNGYKTYASVRNTQSAGTLSLRKIATEENLSLEIIEIDISKDKSVQKGVDYIYRKSKQIDILVNNAGWGDKGPVEEYTVSEIQDQYQTNVFGMLRMVKAVAPIMRRQQSGLILNVSSIFGIITFPMTAIYSSAKHAVEALTEALRFELSHFGIKVTIVEPGYFLTEGYYRNFKKLHNASEKHSVYKSMTKRYMNNLDTIRKNAEHNHLLSHLFNPQKVADKIFNISQEGNPKLKYRIGIDAQMYFLAKKILPARVWEWVLHYSYQW